MKKTIKALKFSAAFLLIVSSFIACDKDFNVIESDVLGTENSNFTTDNAVYPISAYNRKLNSLQINNLASNLLGVFNDPAYGKTTASIITQVTPTSFNPDFGENTVIDSVVINIPYFNTVVGTDDDGYSKYALDSLYGNPEAPIKLSIYQNNYFLRDFDPNSTLNNTQNYYSNASSTLNSAFTSTSEINFDDHIAATIYEEDIFTPSKNAIKTTIGEGDDAVTTRTTPAFRVVFNQADYADELTFWKETIIDKQDDPVLSNANNFKDYFRGLYFKAESIGSDGNMFLINLASTAANITIYYSKDSSVEGETIQSTYVLNFTGNKINTFINDYNLVTLQNGDKDLGDEKLYLKGAEGSMAVIDLFGNEDTNNNEIADALEDFINEYRQTDDNGEFIKNKTTGNFLLKKLINDAHLEIYEDETMPTLPVDENGDAYHKYDRIYAYDIKNNTPTIDYLIDATENSQSAFSSKIISLSQRDTVLGRYKIRLTEHLNSILLRDSTNTKIGLVLSTNVNYTNNAKILQSNDAVTAVPAASLLTPRGTILYGSNENVSEGKRLKLKVFFTEPKQD
ncbi:protein of unknown function [Flaviramulus basaltis]|uniref:DUF4270 domain-containing protein n=1 Tax=Flaviramulus basaltis TaxID=369401 RepID=A0A1K2IBQ2_9FLAO|nr:DUF4270 domain-containing protein [Flaviramulus basaltis]SFZ89817.1 protein of unknown function [Flaviramulus basaltis]